MTAREPIRFPADFMFQLTKQEFDDLRSQIVTSSWGGRRYPPYTFTEQGVSMLSSVLRSKRAIQVNIEIMRAFVQLRRMLASHADLARKLSALEKKYDAPRPSSTPSEDSWPRQSRRKNERLGFHRRGAKEDETPRRGTPRTAEKSHEARHRHR